MFKQNMNIKYIFCHGFGFTQLYWKNISSLFSEENCIYLDLGYFGNPNTYINTDTKQYTFVGIGHSFGLIKLLQYKIPFKYLIGLNSFVNFLGYDTVIHRKRKLELTFLKKSFINNPVLTLKEFYKKCGLHEFSTDFQKLNKDLLLQDLQQLELSYTIPSGIQICIISAKNDIIVPTNLINDNLRYNLNIKHIFLELGHHTLGFTNSYQVKILIDNFLNART